MGKPGEIKITKTKHGDIYQTKIGEDGRAVIERHNTDHNRPHTGHTNPHDHKVLWSNEDGHPFLGDAINYPDQNYPAFKGMRLLTGKEFTEDNNPYRFQSISDFKRSLSWGMEAEFVWKGVHYGVVRYGVAKKITVYECGKPETDFVCETPDDALEFMVGEDRLRDVITQVDVWARTI